jgi:transposase
MAAKPIAMDQLKRILHLHEEGHSIKAIVRLTGVARNTVKRYLEKHAAAAGISAQSSEKQLSENLYNADDTLYKGPRHVGLLAHFEHAERDLLKKGVTRLLLWREYQERHPDGYGYSQYCYHLQQFLQKKDVVMHLEYTPAEIMMVDFAGTKYPYVDTSIGERILCEVFVATLPYSGLIFYYAVPTQRITDFAEAISAALIYFCGAPQTILCDNLRTAVTRTDRYEPQFTDLCYQLSDHYFTTFSATRPYKPRDKAMVEKAVNLLYKSAYAPLRNRIFTSIKEINYQFRIQVDQLNRRPYKGSSYSRRDIFMQEEQSLLRELPNISFTIKKGVELTVQRNYHIQLTEGHLYYSVPWQYTGKKVKVWYDTKTVEIYCDHERIAVHPRSRNGYSTLKEHMPPNHQQAQEAKGWSRETLLAKATRIGPRTAEAATVILGTSIYMEQNYKSCYGMLMLEKRYSKERLEAACSRALTGTRINYTMIKNILVAGLDKQPVTQVTLPLPVHDNIRGPQQYQ